MQFKKRVKYQQLFKKWWNSKYFPSIATIIFWMTTTPEGKQLVRELAKEVGDE